MAGAMTLEDARRVLATPTLWREPDLTEALEVRLEADRAAARIAHEREDVPEPDAGLDAPHDGRAVVVMLLVGVIVGPALCLLVLPHAAEFLSGLFGWIGSVARGFGMVAAALWESLA